MLPFLFLLAVAAEPPLPTPNEPVRLLLHLPGAQPAPSTACTTELCASLLALVQRATTSIDFAIYGLRGQPAILDALAAAQARGVRVRGVVDRTLDGRNLYADTDAMVARLGSVRDDLAVDQRTARRQRPYDPTTSRCWLPLAPSFRGPRQCVGYDLGDRCLIAAQASDEELSFQGEIMHHKFFVVDGRYVWTGSTNVSDTCSGGYNANLVAVLDAPAVAAWYTREFEELYAGRHHEEKANPPAMEARLTPELRVEGWFSPKDRPLTRGVQRWIAGARERVDVAIFFLTHKGVAGALIAAHRRGVAVRVLADASGATNGYTKVELLRAAGVPVKIEDWGGKMHAKAAAIDGRTAIVGSMNWTSAGEWGNDENTLVLHGPGPARQLHAWFDTAWAAVPERWLQGRPDPESRDSGTACSDGVDNDHDGAVDRADPGCGAAPPPLASLPPWRIVPKAEGQPLVKGTVEADGTRRAWLPSDAGWGEVRVDPTRGEAFFCSQEEARSAGFPTVGQVFKNTNTP